MTTLQGRILIVIRAATCEAALRAASEHDIPATLYSLKADAVWLSASVRYRREILFWQYERGTSLVFAGGAS